MKKYKTPIFIVLGLALLIFLMALPKLTDPNRDIIKEWNNAGVECINGHQNLAMHFHPVLTVVIDGEEERIPPETGIVSTCMAEIHTHDSTGELHVESSVPKDITLDQFFAVWGQDLVKEGYELNATVDGESIEDPANLILADRQQIRLEYSSSTTSTESNS